MTKSEARSTLESLIYALYLFLATAFALRYSASGRDSPYMSPIKDEFEDTILGSVLKVGQHTH
ncbi:hypothetical protein Taro_025272, partial [Colocasia esculenta]|nr:hypothetical protein [Colocasia esculenta]